MTTPDPSDILSAAQVELDEAERLYMTVKEYAASRRLHVQTVYTAIRYRRFPYPVERCGGAIRICVPRGSIADRKRS